MSWKSAILGAGIVGLLVGLHFCAGLALAEEAPEAEASSAEVAAPETPAPEKELTYHRDIAPLLTKHCIDCHGPELADGEFRVDRYRLLMTGGAEAGASVVAGEPDASPLIEYLTGKRLPRMPKQRKALDETEIALIRDWIAQGAPEGKRMPPPTTFTPEQIEFFEASVRPILVKHCVECHGDERANGGLAFLSRQDLLDGGVRGPTVVPGDPEESLLIKAVRRSGKLQMPKNRPALEVEEIELLEKWIEIGAPWPESHSTTPPKIRKRFVIYESDREHWAFQPVRRPELPAVADASWPQDDLDRFILARLEEAKLAPAPAAERGALLRRLSYDLTGLPPKPDDLKRWLAPDSKLSVADYVDQLLASEEFGVHWGRHWLDNVRFRPGSQRTETNDPYKQWVVRALNADLPYDQFLQLQIAGDLMPADNPDEVNLDGMIAVRPWAIKANPEDQIDLLGRTFLGMSLFCARCHDHKLEPISRHDYFAIRGIFESTKVSKAPLLKEKSQSEEYAAGLARSTANEARMKKELKEFGSLVVLVDVQMRMETERSKLDDPAQKKDAVEKNLAKLLDEEQSKIAEMKKKGIDLSSAGAEEFMKLRRENLQFAEKWKDVYQLDVLAEGDKIVDARPPTIGAPQTRGQPPPLDPAVPRRFPTILAGEEQTPLSERTPNSGRLELAQWLADPQHPITPRLMTNRVWQYLLGEGLVSSSSNFGRSGELPSHPELLDYLADDFVQSGWSIKTLIRRIVLSSTYQQASSVECSEEERSERTRFFGLARRKRLEVEQLCRTIEGLIDDPQADRRSELPTDFARELRSLFDGANSDLIVPQRTASVSPLQALLLLNSDQVRTASERFALRLLRNSDERQRIDDAYWLLYGRAASEQEIAVGLEFVSQWPATGKYPLDSRTKTDVPLETLERWQAYVQALLLSNELMFID